MGGVRRVFPELRRRVSLESTDPIRPTRLQERSFDSVPAPPPLRSGNTNALWARVVCYVILRLIGSVDIIEPIPSPSIGCPPGAVRERVIFVILGPVLSAAEWIDSESAG